LNGGASHSEKEESVARTDEKKNVIKKRGDPFQGTMESGGEKKKWTSQTEGGTLLVGKPDRLKRGEGFKYGGIVFKKVGFGEIKIDAKGGRGLFGKKKKLIGQGGEKPKISRGGGRVDIRNGKGDSIAGQTLLQRGKRADPRGDWPKTQGEGP